MIVFRQILLVLLALCATSGLLRAQQPTPKASASPTPSPTPQASDQEPPVRVFTEEVRLPVTALDAYGHYDPTLEPDDVLVLEDGVAQQVKSIRHIPANVLFVLDTGGELSGVGGVSKSTSLTKQTAMDLVQRLPEGSWISIIQSGNSAQVIQPWTKDKGAVLKALKTKLLSSKRSRFSDALVTASQQLKDRPEGSRHVVLITDGVDSPGGKTDRAEAMKKLIAVRATVHVISYTEFVQQKSENKTTAVSPSMGPAGPITQTDPTLPPGTTRSPSYGISIRFDPAMRRQRKAYEAEVKKSEPVLANVADETGGKFLLPLNSEEMVAKASEVARAIGAEYVVTYRPKRPLAEAPQGEYRKVEVTARRVGLSLHSRRGYVVPTREQ
ncbi:MAG TPA: VWA domain-containing protein [Pyrinomonadaceae bacterium]|nr:VWA domain-containing protein [Pyrinomonadaceae bacterium]